ncbi:diguanylate cyclase [Amycolatopsis sp. PS_44_ISF1]|uniref:diguanylate cyclase n=1 Tax=Amycolatopsis sp. PS_44_ISF1 TaxID=2974917 RepID=UPI0028DE9866|nr:diguanylate cyclase [Amycolatopsis sp. PS_44_ISF1]MDT8913900.1 diguanylate cyclase [Amycolatopsis sp. PS_44_ISF1]
MMGDSAAAGRRWWLPSPTAWALWHQPRLVLLLVVDLLALAATVAAVVLVPVTLTAGVRFAILLAGLLGCAELCRSAERGRAEALLGPGFGTPWLVAGVLVLPPGPAVALAVACGLHRWARIRRRPLHRQVFEVAATVVAVLLAVGFLLLTGPGPAVVAALVFGVVGALLPAAVDGRAPRGGSAVLFDGAMLALGVVLAWAVQDSPWVLPALAGGLVVLYRGEFGRAGRDAASVDPGTGVLTAVAWWDAARETPAPAFSVLVLDLDRFGDLNSRHGRRIGDAVLRAIADALRAEVRSADLVGRSGGGEFAVLLPGTGCFDALAIAERIRLRVASTAVALKAAHGSPQFAWATVSVGVAARPDHGEEAAAVFAAASGAVRRAKEAGRNRTVRAPSPQR